MKTGIGSSLTTALILTAQAVSAQTISSGTTAALPLDFNRTLAPSQILLSSTPRADAAPLTVGKHIQADDFSFSGGVSARDSGFAVPDYRANLGVGYQTQLGSIARFSSRASYATDSLLGADWQVESHLAKNLALNINLHYDETTRVTPGAMTPRAALTYRLEELSTVSAQFDPNGYKVGMERSTAGGTRGRVSYARKSMADALAPSPNVLLEQQSACMSLDVPMPQKLITSFELEYVNNVGAFATDLNRDYVVHIGVKRSL